MRRESREKVFQTLFSGSSGARSFFGSMYRRKYQEDSTKVSNVSVSRRPGFPQEGQGTRSQSSAPARGFPRSRVYGRSSGSTTGRSFSGTGTMPHASQWITGIGQPQYRCRLTPQSRSRYWIVPRPIPFPSR